jgi:hypothetical protein
MNATTTTEALILAGDGYHLKVSPEAHERKAELLSKASTVTQVTSIEESSNAQFHLRRCAEMRILIEKSRKAVKEPVLLVGKAIDKAAADFTADIDAEEKRLSLMIGKHAEEVARLQLIKEKEERRSFEEARAARLAKEQANKPLPRRARSQMCSQPSKLPKQTRPRSMPACKRARNWRPHSRPPV